MESNNFMVCVPIEVPIEVGYSWIMTMMVADWILMSPLDTSLLLVELPAFCGLQ